MSYCEAPLLACGYPHCACGLAPAPATLANGTTSDEAVKPLFYMTVERLERHLAGLDKKTKIRFHARGALNLSVLSIYLARGLRA